MGPLCRGATQLFRSFMPKRFPTNNNTRIVSFQKMKEIAQTNFDAQIRQATKERMQFEASKTPIRKD